MKTKIAEELRRIGCFKAEPSPETIMLERWCRIGTDICIGVCIGFVTVALVQVL